MRWGERGGDGRERFRDIGRYELEIERDRERVRWVRERVRDGGRYGLERKGEMGGREIQRWRKI